MSEPLGTSTQIQETAEPLLSVQKMQFWLDTVVAWDQACGSEAQRDTSLYTSKLKEFLQAVQTQISKTGSTTETMRKLPLLGQILGRLCWNPHVTVGDTNRGLLLQCLWGLYSEHSSNAVEVKANNWIRKVLCLLATEEDDTVAQALMKATGMPVKEYHHRVLKKMVTQQQEQIGRACCIDHKIDQRCKRGVNLATSEVCVPLITCPEVSPLICSLLQQRVSCFGDALSKDFLDTVHSANLRSELSLDERATISLWYHNLPSLEEAVLGLLESMTTTEETPQNLEQLVVKSLLPKACAEHCSMFLVVSDIFRSILKQVEGSQAVKVLIQTITRCLLTELEQQQNQTPVSLKAFFPQSPPSLLAPLLTLPSGMPQETWKNHLKWVGASLQQLTEQQEKEEGDEDSPNSRGQHTIFEAWFLLVQSAHWVLVAEMLLATLKPDLSCPVLWLLTFYHHPTNRWHCRARHLEQAKKVWSHLHALTSVPVPPFPTDQLQPLVTALSSRTDHSPQAPPVALSLLVNFAVFCRLTDSDSVEFFQTVVDQSGLLGEAARALRSLQHRLNEESFLSSDAVRVRIKRLQDAITLMRTDAATHTPAPDDR